MSEEEKPKSLFQRVVDTVILSGAAAVTLALISGALAFMWDKSVNFDKNVKDLTAGIEATQQVTGQELMEIKGQVVELTNEIRALNATLTDVQKYYWGKTLAEASAPQPALSEHVQQQVQQVQQQQQQQMQQQAQEVQKYLANEVSDVYLDKIKRRAAESRQFSD